MSVNKIVSVILGLAICGGLIAAAIVLFSVMNVKQDDHMFEIIECEVTHLTKDPPVEDFNCTIVK